jgi:nicotinamidase-related amidase
MECQRGIMGDLSSLPDLRDAATDCDLVPHIRNVLDVARDLSLPVIHCTVEQREDGKGTVSNTPLHTAVFRNGGHIIEGTDEASLVPELGLAPHDIVSSRVHGVSPFLGTSLDQTLRNLGVKVIIVTGVSLNLAIPGLCIEAVNLGYQVILPKDGVCGTPKAYADDMLRYTLSLICRLAATDEICAALRDLSAP